MSRQNYFFIDFMLFTFVVLVLCNNSYAQSKNSDSAITLGYGRLPAHNAQLYRDNRICWGDGPEGGVCLRPFLIKSSRDFTFQLFSDDRFDVYSPVQGDNLAPSQIILQDRGTGKMTSLYDFLDQNNVSHWSFTREKLASIPVVSHNSSYFKFFKTNVPITFEPVQIKIHGQICVKGKSFAEDSIQTISAQSPALVSLLVNEKLCFSTVNQKDANNCLVVSNFTKRQAKLCLKHGGNLRGVVRQVYGCEQEVTCECNGHLYEMGKIEFEHENYGQCLDKTAPNWH